ncbi:MAG: hypothetical protein AAGE59_03390 [Cyanobacteria bacterium P01_F01_bin.86]
MAPSKLSDTDKQTITELYCLPGETTSTLANKFGVSSSTVGRVLKQQLSDEDYAQLMQWKRSGERGSLDLSYQGTAGERSSQPETTPVSEPAQPTEPMAEQSAEADITPPETKNVEAEDIEVEASEAENVDLEASEKPKRTTASRRRLRRRSSAPTVTEEVDREDQLPLDLDVSEAESVSPPSVAAAADSDAFPDESSEEDTLLEERVAAEWVADDLSEVNDYEDGDYDEDEDEDEDEDADLDEDEDNLEEEASDDWEQVPLKGRRVLSSSRQQEQMTVLPFETLVLKRPCYLVVDRLSELITCPLKDFAELGLIPEEEEYARTLPVFDNHRIARRFSRRNQRIVKVPDGMMLTKTQQYLHAKGITRILFDGQVYALN